MRIDPNMADILREQRSVTTNARRGISISIPFVIVGAVITACASTELKEQWRDSDYRAAPDQRVLVIAVIGREERRRAAENQFVKHLRESGIDAVASYPQLSVNGPTDIDAARRVVERNGATLVLSVRLLDMTSETRVTGGYQAGGYYGMGGFYGYYPYAAAGAYYPPDVYTHRTIITETRVFDIKSDKMVWAATMKTKDTSDFTDTASHYANLVVKQLQYNKIINSR